MTTTSDKIKARADRNSVDNVIIAQNILNAAADLDVKSEQWLNRFHGLTDPTDITFFLPRIARHNAERNRYADAAEQIESIDIVDNVELDRTIRRIRRSAMHVLTHSDVTTANPAEFAAAQSMVLATAIEL